MRMETENHGLELRVRRKGLSRKESSDQTEMSTQTGNGDILVVEYIPYIYSL